jgi:GTP pyrophosphokinase
MVSIEKKLVNSFHRSVRDKYPEEEARPILQALSYSRDVHSGQLRRSGEPFFFHPLRVAQTLVSWGQPANVVIAGLLHDSVEDTHVSRDRIIGAFSEEIAYIVSILTKHSITVNPQNCIEILDNCPQIYIIKIADRLDNMRTMDCMPPEKSHKKSLENLCLYIPIARHLKLFAAVEELLQLSRKYLATNCQV